MKKKMIYIIIPIVSCILAILLLIGVQTVFKTCVHADGSFGPCHIAQNVVVLESVILIITSLSSLIFRDNKSLITSNIATAGVSFITLLTPGVLFSLCKSQNMCCNTKFRPFVIVITIIMIIISLSSIVYASLNLKKGGK